MEIKIKKIHKDAKIPKYSTDGAACFDLFVADDNIPNILHLNNKHIVLGTGLIFEIPKGYVMKIYSRSGHGFNYNVRLANCVGILDSDYRGECKVKLTLDDYDCVFKINKGDRIAQAMIEKVEQISFLEKDVLSETERNGGGFGSTGR